MRRQVGLEEISDGRLYSRHDMVRVGCGGCRGCSACCHGMGTSAILDPLDVHRLSQGTGLPVEALFADKLELNVVDGIILPNLRMNGSAQGISASALKQPAREGSFDGDGNDVNGTEEACGFLNSEGRCSVHPYRPGVCRLFPLGRYYIKTGETVSFSYFVQTHECPAPNKTKVRVEKWLDQPDLAGYEDYILKWHNFLEQAEALVKRTADDGEIKNIELYILKLFFMKPYDPRQDFYVQFEERMNAARDVLDV
ncbi:MAG: YkgJ family cysteine cluster protein [Clostridiales bacterium]|nr:YkgJ family cysteine cluster protein [Clostridiales bacterium]